MTTLKQDQKFIDNILAEQEWKCINTNFYNCDLQKNIVLHEIGHTIFSYKNKNFKYCYIFKFNNIIKCGLVFQKRNKLSLEEKYGFYYSGLLSTFIENKDIKKIIIALYDMCPDKPGFKKFDESIYKLIKFLENNKKEIKSISNIVYRDLLKSKENFIKITEKDLEKYLQMVNKNGKKRI